MTPEIKIILALIGVLATLASAIPIAFRLIDKRSARKNGFPNIAVGFGQKCIDHGEALVKLETELPHIRKSVENLDEKMVDQFTETFKMLDEIKKNGKKVT